MVGKGNRKGKAEEFKGGQLACEVHFMKELNRFSQSGALELVLPTKFVIPKQMKMSKPSAYTPQGGLFLGLNRRMCGPETEEGRMVTELKAKWAIAYLLRRRRRPLAARAFRMWQRSIRRGSSSREELALPESPLPWSVGRPGPWSGTLKAKSSWSITADWKDFVRALGIRFPDDLQWYELGFDYLPSVHEAKLQNVLATDALFVALYLLHEAGVLSEEDEFMVLTKDPQFNFLSHYFWNDLFLLENQIPWMIVEAVIADFCSQHKESFFFSDYLSKRAVHVALESRFRTLFPLQSDDAFLQPSSETGLVDQVEESYWNVHSRKPRHLLDYLLGFICLDTTGWANTWTIIPTSIHDAHPSPYSSIRCNYCFDIPSELQVAELGCESSRETLIQLFRAPHPARNPKEEEDITRLILEQLDKHGCAALQSTATPAREEEDTKWPLIQVGVDDGTWPPHSDNIHAFADEGKKASVRDGVSFQAGDHEILAFDDATQLEGSRQQGGPEDVRRLHRDLEGIGVRRRWYVPGDRFRLALLTLLMNVLVYITGLWIYLGKGLSWLVSRCLVVPIDRLILIDITRSRASHGERWRWSIARFDFSKTTKTHAGTEWHGMYYYDNDSEVCYFNPLRLIVIDWVSTYVLFLSVAISTKQLVTEALRKVSHAEDEESRVKRCAPVLAYFRERAAVMRRLHQELHPCHPVHTFLRIMFPDAYWKKVMERKDWAGMVQVLLEAVAARPPVDPIYAKAILQALPDAFKKERRHKAWPAAFLDPVNPAGSPAEGDKWQVRADSAKTLAAAGVRLGRCYNLQQVDMELSPKECLRLPQLHVHAGTESLLRNLAAWERIRDEKEMPLASYINLMDNLIDTEEDVVLMKEAKVIDHHLASDKAVADLWNELSVGLLLRPSSRWARVLGKVNERAENTWGKMRTEFMRTYFSTPWSFIALVAASLLLLLTVAQTVISVLQLSP